MKLRNTVLSLFTALAGCSVGALPAGNFTAAGNGPGMRRVYFNLYTDSLKPVLNYYVNVEGETAEGNYLPLDSNTVVLTASWGQMRGNEWIIPPVLLRDRVTFYVTSRQNPRLSDSVTIWIQKWKDPRDEPGYVEPGTEDLNPRRSGR